MRKCVKLTPKNIVAIKYSIPRLSQSVEIDLRAELKYYGNVKR